MIPVQHGLGGWVSSRSTLAKAMAIVSVGLMLALVGCSSKKPASVGDTNPNGNQLGENGTGAGGGTTNEDWEKGTVGRGGPLSDIHFGYNDYTISDQDGPVLKSNASWLQGHANARVQVEAFAMSAARRNIISRWAPNARSRRRITS